MPSFEYKGPLAGMAAHRQHCSFGFWKGELITDSRTGRPLERTDAMGHFGRAKRISTALEWLAEGKSRNWKYERNA